MNRTTQRPAPQLARASDIEMIFEARSAVDRAMEHFHETNPAGYHGQRPTMTRCPFNTACPFTASDTG